MGMGGQPDDPRDLSAGHENIIDDDRTRAVDGAQGGRRNDVSAGSVTGVPGDKDITGRIPGVSRP